MRRIAIFGVLVGAGLVAVRASGVKLHERLMARCEGVFERMPDTFPPKRMLRGIEETRANTARILELLGADEEKADEAQVPQAASSEAGHDAA